MSNIRKNKSKLHAKSRLSSYSKNGKKLTPPMLKINESGGGVVFSSWVNDRLPDILWCVLLRMQCPNDWKEIIMKILGQLSELDIDDKKKAITHTGISAMPEKLKEEFIKKIVTSCGNENLRPLLLIKCMPDYKIWSDAIKLKEQSEDWCRLGDCVYPMLDSHSREATDVMWMKAMGRIFVSHDISIHEEIDGIRSYPLGCDQKKIGAFVRCIDIGTSASDDKTKVWCDLFWKYCLENTECVPMFDPEVLSEEMSKMTEENYQKYYKKVASIRLGLIDHFYDSIKTTAVDPKFETVFGLAQYALDNASECMLSRTGAMISGRITIRVLFEVYITLKYLIQQEKTSYLWWAYREYGQGQYSLIESKYKEMNLDSVLVDMPMVELITNEDKSTEFIPINLGNWNNTNLRKICEKVDEKQLYDKYYDYTSGFIHANWGAVRESSMQKCMNPLHRLHNVPAWGLLVLPNVCEDAYCLIDKIVDLADSQYPGLLSKIKSRQDEFKNESISPE